MKKGGSHSEETKAKISASKKGHLLTEEHKRKISAALKGRRKGKDYFTKEAKEMISLALSGRKLSKSTKQKMALAKLGKKRPPRPKKWNSRIGAALAGRKLSKDSIRKRTETWKKNFPLFRDKWLRAMRLGRRTKPNKPEAQLMKLLESIQPGEWKYVGDGAVIIAGKNPDFININGKKLIIEMFGDYWHRNDDPKKRAAVFKPFGFRTLVIWEHELKNEVKVVNRVLRFEKR